MNTKNTLTWKDALTASPGPTTFKEAGILFLKGLCMGSADIIPGVSGGTIALITGIYEDLLQAIGSINARAVKKLFQFDFKGMLQDIHLRFLVSLLLGIGVAIISLARLMHFLLNHYPVFTWSLFFGLIAASILIVGKNVRHWAGLPALWFILGTAVAYFIVSMIPVSTPQDLWFIFLAGFIAICAMILPGLSGAFLLLILGKYEYITGMLKNPFIMENMIVILIFIAGAISGLLMFSRVLSYLLARHQNVMMAFLTGLMAGAMKKIWPWKEVVEQKIVRGKPHVLVDKNILPQGLDSEFFIAVLLAAAGFIIVILLDRFSQKNPSLR